LMLPPNDRFRISFLLVLIIISNCERGKIQALSTLHPTPQWDGICATREVSTSISRH